MSPIVAFYGSYQLDRIGIRTAQLLANDFVAHGDTAKPIDAKIAGLPMIDRMYEGYPEGTAPPAMVGATGIEPVTPPV